MWRLALLLLVPSVACSSPKIVNGQDADIEDRPYQVGLDVGGFGLCGGSIVDKRVVLTAAHCVEWMSGNVTVHAGSALWMNDSVTAKAVNAVIHPRHDGMSSYDAALLLIDRDFVYDKKIQPATLASRVPSPGEEVTASGWGRLRQNGSFSVVLQQVTMSYIDRETCAEKLGVPLAALPESYLCSFAAGQSPCNGDSGGPLTDSSGHLVGINAAVMECGSTDMPCFYTSVPAIRDWVQHTARALTASTAKYMLPLIPY